MSLTRRRFTQILASTLFLHHLPSFAQSVKFWASLTLPEAQHITHRQRRRARRFTIAGCRARKNGRFSSFDFARQALIPLPEHIRQFPGWDDSPGAPAHSLEGLYGVTSRFGR